MNQFKHDAKQLRAIADLLEAMNRFDEQMQPHSVSVQVGPEIWWCDRLMGHIVRQDEDDNEGPWVYRPDAYGYEPEVRWTAEQLASKPKESVFPKTQPDAQFRLLEAGEVIQEGDWTNSPSNDLEPWPPAGGWIRVWGCHIGKTVQQAPPAFPMWFCRKIKDESEVEPNE
jgi:hypothetical protein